MSTLVIVESPGKIKKLTEYLGSNYIVKACYGHVMDLDKKTLSIEIENNFNPLYVISPEKKKVIKDLQITASKCSNIILASDNDREGETIAFNLANILKINNPSRIIFNEITKQAIQQAIQNPTTINENIVHAQQTRRILDRLVGYKISPILSTFLSSLQSAGRVQSVVVKIINDKENEINTVQQSTYYKTHGFFNHSTIKVKSSLEYNFNNEELVYNFIKMINKNTLIQVDYIENKQSEQIPPAPYITSTLQQDASIKLHFNVKMTMDIAQKLYEGGFITYMRTDCPNISPQVIPIIEQYIINRYGTEYASPKKYKSKNATSQDAHECIRPTNINLEKLNSTDYKQQQLYQLIWIRTIASQMSNARIDNQIIKINMYNNKNSILIFENKQYFFITNNKNIIFPGYLILYSDNTDSTTSEINNHIQISQNDILTFDKLNISEEYTKLPIRYTEASLIKYLEKNGIGRPSTYASIISKVIERKYVEIKNIDGVTNSSKHFILNNKYELIENNNEIVIGGEKNKIIITDIGIQINNFLTTHFNTIIDIPFTATIENYLDNISEGKANWITILKNFYEPFKLQLDKVKLLPPKVKEDKDTILGITPDGEEIYSGSGKYGPYIKIMREDKWKYYSIKDCPNITLEDAKTLIAYPKVLGKYKQNNITLHKGNYGLYIQYQGNNISAKTQDESKITLEYALELIQEKQQSIIKTFKHNRKTYNILNGSYGYYIQIINIKSKTNIHIPKKYDINNITLDTVLELSNKKINK